MQSLNDWLEANADEIDRLRLFSMETLPDDLGGIHNELSRAQSDYARATQLLSSAESFVLTSHAIAVHNTRKNNPDISSKEREILAKAEIANVIKLRDDIAGIVSSLKQKAYSLMSSNRTHSDERKITR